MCVFHCYLRTQIGRLRPDHLDIHSYARHDNDISNNGACVFLNGPNVFDIRYGYQLVHIYISDLPRPFAL